MASKGNASTTLYVQNLDTKIKKDDLRRSLYHLFSTHGKVLDIVSTRAPNMRGQAFVVFRDLSSSAAAMRALDGERVFGRGLRISYARTTSHATILHTSGAEALYAVRTTGKSLPANSALTGKLTVSDAQKKLAEAEAKKGKKRGRESDEEESDEDGGPEKKRREAEDDEMQMDESSDDESPPKKAVEKPPVVEMPAAREVGEVPYQVLFVEGLPREVTDDMLSVLFQQYPGFQSVRLVPSLAPTTPNSGLAFVQYDTPGQAEQAKLALDGFQIARGVGIKVGWAKRG
ncbi:RNA-binding domain-containing protein [Atractiella rhizophila]|nr:RNA-binding domain-containing protein [Atractiella rhizophila]